jgi:hypothetical protein
MAKFQAGELEEVYRDWLGFFERTRRLKLDVATPCHVQGKKMLGVLHLVLMKDTADAIGAFQNLSLNAPFIQLWDLNLPYEVQALWDSVRAEWGPELTDEEAWEYHWLPPPLYDPNAPSGVYVLRKSYHDNRVLYGLAAGQDPEPYIRILQNTENQSDPAFILMRTDVMSRLGYGPKRIESELAHFSTPSSVVVGEYNLSAWRTRLGKRVARLASGVEMKPEAKPTPTVPTLNIESEKKKKR